MRSLFSITINKEFNFFLIASVLTGSLLSKDMSNNEQIDQKIETERLIAEAKKRQEELNDRTRGGKESVDNERKQQRSLSPEEEFLKRSMEVEANAADIVIEYDELIDLLLGILCKAEGEHDLARWLQKRDQAVKNNSTRLGLIRMKQQQNICAFTNAQEVLKAENEKAEPNSEDYHFQPKQPIALTATEKKNTVNEIIAKEFIGKVPNQVQDVVNYFVKYDEFSKYNFKAQNLILLHGKPGTGKSHLVKVLAHALQIPLLSFTGSFFGDKYIGESSKRIRKASATAKNYGKPIIVFIDEIDALAIKRSDNMHNEHRSALITLLDELQQLKECRHVIVVVATNTLDALDPAITDRFAGTICEIKDLTAEERAQLFLKIFRESNHKIVIKDKDETLPFSHRLAEVTAPSGWDSKENEYKNRFSNRDIEYIAQMIIFKAKTSSRIPTCKDAREAIDNTGKKGSFANWTSPTYCEGI